ncbi:hypothetical protein DH2020_038692 [Rehmannia glutinosa]|uniref:U-box domain-containing protein n=1 Tax=Rehmannia glutinosa TaxID=99300 RepID=A0ABR0UZ15_REHGL
MKMTQPSSGVPLRWAWLLEHADSIAVVAKRLLRVSPVTDDRILCLLESIARFSTTHAVVMEIFEGGWGFKMCMVLQSGLRGLFQDVFFDA